MKKVFFLASIVLAVSLVACQNVAQKETSETSETTRALPDSINAPLLNEETASTEKKEKEQTGEKKETEEKKETGGEEKNEKDDD